MVWAFNDRIHAFSCRLLQTRCPTSYGNFRGEKQSKPITVYRLNGIRHWNGMMYRRFFGTQNLGRWGITSSWPWNSDLEVNEISFHHWPVNCMPIPLMISFDCYLHRYVWQIIACLQTVFQHISTCSFTFSRQLVTQFLELIVPIFSLSRSLVSTSNWPKCSTTLSQQSEVWSVSARRLLRLLLWVRLCYRRSRSPGLS